MLRTIRTSAGDFRIRADEHTTDHDVAAKIARRLGHRDAWITNSSGARNTYQVNVGRATDSGMNVARTVTVYR